MYTKTYTTLTRTTQSLTQTPSPCPSTDARSPYPPTGDEPSITDCVIVKYETDAYFATQPAKQAYYIMLEDEDQKNNVKDVEEQPELKEYEHLIDVDEDYEGGDVVYEKSFNQLRLISGCFQDDDGNKFYIVNVHGGTVTCAEPQMDFIYLLKRIKEMQDFKLDGVILLMMLVCLMLELVIFLMSL